MSYTSLFRFGPAATPNTILGDARRGGRVLYDQLSLCPGGEWPVLIDHNDAQPIGRVREIFRMEDTQPFELWHAALCDIDDPPPSWLKVGNPVSFAFSTLHRWEHNGWQIIRRGLVNEVSILSPGVAPAESLARVCTLSRQSQDSPLAVGPRNPPKAAAGGELIVGGIIRRNCGRVIAVY